MQPKDNVTIFVIQTNQPKEYLMSVKSKYDVRLDIIDFIYSGRDSSDRNLFGIVEEYVRSLDPTIEEDSVELYSARNKIVGQLETAILNLNLKDVS